MKLHDIALSAQVTTTLPDTYRGPGCMRPVMRFADLAAVANSAECNPVALVAHHS